MCYTNYTIKFRTVSKKFAVFFVLGVIGMEFMTKYKFVVDTRCTNKFHTTSMKFTDYIDYRT